MRERERKEQEASKGKNELSSIRTSHEEKEAEGSEEAKVPCYATIYSMVCTGCFGKSAK